VEPGAGCRASGTPGTATRHRCPEPEAARIQGGPRRKSYRTLLSLRPLAKPRPRHLPNPSLKHPASSSTPPPPLGRSRAKVGFFQLPPKPGIKPVEKVGSLKPAPRAPEPRRTEFTKRGDIRSCTRCPASGRTDVWWPEVRPFPKGAKAQVGAPAVAAPKIALPADAASHLDQASNRGQGTGGTAQTKAFQDYADLMEVGGVCHVNRRSTKT